MANYQGRYGANYSLKNTPLASGGEGEVYEINGKKDYVAKIYRSNKFTPSKTNQNPRKHIYDKIITMLDQPVNVMLNGGVPNIAWPTDVLLEHGQFVGYVMPRISVKSSIIEGEREGSRVSFFGKYSWKTSVGLAYNLANLVCSVHVTGASIGDFNPQNFLLDPKGYITAVDTDSFNIVNKKTNEVFKCNVGVPEMLAPELQGRDLSNPRTKFDKYTDYFSLAIHIFLLLMNNRHPFNVIMPPNTRSSSSNGGLEHNITNGMCPYTTGSKWAKQKPPGTLDPNFLPDYIRNLFDRAFSYDVSTAVRDEVRKKRPTAEEWRVALGRLLKEIDDQSVFMRCKKDNAHIFMVRTKSCPFCDAKKSQAVPMPQPAPPNRSPGPLNTNHVQSPQTKKKLGQRISSFGNSIIKPKGYYTNKRKSWPLYVASIPLGMLGGYLISPAYMSLIWSLGAKLSLSFVQICMLIIGLAAGILNGKLFEQRYRAANNGYIALLLSLIAPVIAILGGGAVILGIYIFILVVVVWFIIGFIGGLLSGG